MRPLTGSSTERMPIRWPSGCRSGTKRASRGCQPSGPVRGRDGRDVRARRVRVPVELAVRHVVGAAAREAGVEQRLPHLASAGVAQKLLGLGAPVHRRHLEVVPRRPVQVHAHGGEPQRLRDRLGDRREQAAELLLRPHDAGHLEEPAEPRERFGIVRAHCRRPRIMQRNGCGRRCAWPRTSRRPPRAAAARRRSARPRRRSRRSSPGAACRPGRRLPRGPRRCAR